jgi:hypothetical protein
LATDNDARIEAIILRRKLREEQEGRIRTQQAERERSHAQQGADLRLAWQRTYRLCFYRAMRAIESKFQPIGVQFNEKEREPVDCVARMEIAVSIADGNPRPRRSPHKLEVILTGTGLVDIIGLNGSFRVATDELTDEYIESCLIDLVELATASG